MPLYDYRCLGCGEIFEHLQGVSEPDPRISPCCGASVERLRSVPADHRGRFTAPACQTCCGSDEHVDAPPCSVGRSCCHG